MSEQGKKILVKQEEKERFIELKKDYMKAKSPFCSLKHIEFIDRMIELGREELDLSEELLNERLEKELEEESG